MNNNANNNETDNSEGQTANNANGQIARLQAIAQQSVQPLGFEVLEVQLQHAGGELIVLVRIDRLDEQPVTMADITGASRAAEAEFDRVDPITGEYRLEFESPGAKRPLLRARHFERMVGLKTRVRGDGQAFIAPIKAVDGEDVTFDVNGDDVTLRAGSFTANLAEFPDRHR
ncbi:ribosome maturation factor RimP [Deinococcus frigens]|uniref:ribosome maturation factor RimP n=1 Tax=Deinococcus frigens TaxID=249403 RepID=UPI000A0659C6|nr:ribosome maturation factor RimP [Deinococcus frigens]